MADRPGGDGPPDGPDYGWLYGGNNPPPPDTRIDPQRARPIPVQPRPGQTRVAPAVGTLAPTPPDEQVPMGPPVEYGRSRPTRRPPRLPRLPRLLRPRLRWAFLVIPLYIAYLVLVPIQSWHSVHKVAWEPSGKRPGEQPGTTYLLVGSDSRAGLTRKERRKLGTGNAAGARTDTILLLHTGKGPNLLMSIPRDTQVDIPGHGTTKINAAFAYGGPQLLVRTIENTTGIRIDDYAEIGLGGLVRVVDAVGGITICPKQNIDDPLANLHVKQGCQHANGAVALGYARSRHAFALGDIARVQHQREVIAAIGKKVASPWSVLNPFRYWKLNHALPDTVAFGKGMSVLKAGEFASALTHVNGEKGLTCVVPISNLNVDLDPVRSKELFDKIIHDDTKSVGKSLCSATGLPS